MDFYKVQSGDTLGKIIKKKYGSFDLKKMNAIMVANCISDPDVIHVGQMLKLPDLSRPKTETPRISTNAITNKTAHSEMPSYGKKPAIDIAQLPTKDYWTAKYKKDLLMFHFTAGSSARGALSTFKKPGRVATAYIVGTDGKIYQLFDPACWSYHLGIKGRNSERNRHDKRSIGIEIVNEGPLWKKGGVYKTWWGGTVPADRVFQINRKGVDGFAKFSLVQIESVARLANWLIAEFDIPRQMPKDILSYLFPAFKNFTGVATHENVRTDKYDLGPAFPWDTFRQLCPLTEVVL